MVFICWLVGIHLLVSWYSFVIWLVLMCWLVGIHLLVSWYSFVGWLVLLCWLVGIHGVCWFLLTCWGSAPCARRAWAPAGGGQGRWPWSPAWCSPPESPQSSLGLLTGKHERLTTKLQQCQTMCSFQRPLIQTSSVSKAERQRDV